VTRLWLGITGKFPTVEITGLFALPLEQGFLVGNVEDGSPAADAGLRAGTLGVVLQGVPWILGSDIIMALDGRHMHTPGVFLETMKRMPVGRTIEVEYLREDTRHLTALVVCERPRKAPKGTPPAGIPVAGVRPFGFPQGGLKASSNIEPVSTEASKEGAA